MLSEVSSLDDLFSSQRLLQLLGIACMALVPGALIHRFSQTRLKLDTQSSIGQISVKKAQWLETNFRFESPFPPGSDLKFQLVHTKRLQFEWSNSLELLPKREMRIFQKTLFNSFLLAGDILYRPMNVKGTCVGKKGLGAAPQWCAIETVLSPVVVLSACHAVRLLPPAETITTHRPVCKVQLSKFYFKIVYFQGSPYCI